MSFNIVGSSIHVSKKAGTADMDVTGATLDFQSELKMTGGIKTNSIDTIGNSDMSIKRNGTEIIKLGNDGTNYLDFKSLEVRNLTADIVTELGTDLTIEDSLKIGASSGFKLTSSSGHGNLDVTKVAATDSLALSINSVPIVSVYDDKVTSSEYIQLNGALYSDRAVASGTDTSNYIQFGTATDPSSQTRHITSGTIEDVVNGNTVLTIASDKVWADQPIYPKKGIILAGGSFVDRFIGYGPDPAPRIHFFSTYASFRAASAQYFEYSINGATPMKILEDYVEGTLKNGAYYKIASDLTDFYGGGTGMTLLMEPRTNVQNTGTSLQMKYDYLGTKYEGFRVLTELGDASHRDQPDVYFEQYLTTDTTAWHKAIVLVGDGSIKLNTVSRPDSINILETQVVFNTDVLVQTGNTLTLGSDLAVKPSTNTWTISSDRRLKENITGVSTKTSLEAINKIQIRNFKYTADFREKHGMADTLKLGVVAQELETIPEFASCITTNSDEIFYDHGEVTDVVQIEEIKDDEGNVTQEARTKSTIKKTKTERSRIVDRKQVNMDRVNYTLISAVQELSKRVDYLANKLKDTVTENKALNDRLNALESSNETITGNNVFDSASFGVADVDTQSFVG